METSITNETISQQTICGDPENLNQDHECIEITNDTELKQTQNKEQMTEIKQTRKNLIQAWKAYFKYLSSQKMAFTKSTMKRRAVKGTNLLLISSLHPPLHLHLCHQQWGKCHRL